MEKLMTFEKNRFNKKKMKDKKRPANTVQMLCGRARFSSVFALFNHRQFVFDD
jgi:hypothetical protein